ncbi:hypothetical protein AC249_AIPGENE3107 [Exaiptasia diaphana]|nr:hypothetical protein AC249_AIPGENE3107 [Exaiptasia diaphana]
MSKPDLVEQFTEALEQELGISQPGECATKKWTVRDTMHRTALVPILEKCREQQMPLYIAFIDLTKPFDLQQKKSICEPDLARLKARTKVREDLGDMLFADDAALNIHTQEELQSLMYRFSHACNDFVLTISLKKTNILGQDTETHP